jgi:hypothetical protein
MVAGMAVELVEYVVVRKAERMVYSEAGEMVAQRVA